MKIKIMSIQDLLRIPDLKHSFKIAIIVITTNKNYYDFGYTRFLHLNIPDTDAPVITNYDFERLSYFVKRDYSLFETVYVCCDAGLSRSPATALYIAMKIHDSGMVADIKAKYRFLNESLFEKLMRLT